MNDCSPPPSEIKVARIDHKNWKQGFLRELQRSIDANKDPSTVWTTCPLDNWLSAIETEFWTQPIYQRVAQLHIELHMLADCMLSAPEFEDLTWLERFATTSHALDCALSEWLEVVSTASACRSATEPPS